MSNIIKVEHLTKTFEGSQMTVNALSDVSFTVEKGEIFGIIGLSGAGKSTLVRCLNLLERPTSGKVIVKDQELQSLNEKQLREARKKIGMIFQHFNLLMQNTCLDNVAFPLEIAGKSKKEARTKALEYLKIVGLESKAKAYPAQLSGGQKQRVAIARALINQPKVILADEPTGALDQASGKQVMELFRRLHEEDITIIMITHDANVAANADTLYHIIDGQMSGGDQ